MSARAEVLELPPARRAPATLPTPRPPSARERSADKVWFALTLLYLVVEYGRPMDFVPALGSMRIGMLVSLLLVASWFIRGELKLARSRQTTLMLLFLALLYVFVPFARNNFFAYAYANGFALMLPFFISAVIYFNTLARIRVFAGLWVGFLIYLSVRGLANKGVGGSSFLTDENDFALLINMMIPFAVCLFLCAQGRAMRLACFAGAVLGCLGVMVSFSRGGFVGLVAAGFVLWLLRPKKVQTLVVVLLLAGVVLLFGNEAYWHEMSTITDTTESTAQGRLDAWKAAWDMFKDNPLGVGGGNFPIRFHEYQPPDSGKIKWGTVAHSLWMTLLSETGVVGVVLYGLLLYTNVRDLVWVTRRAHGDDEASRYIHAIALALLAGLAGYFASGTFLSVLYYPHYFYLTAVIVALRRVAEAEGGQPTSESPSGGDPDRAR